MKKAYTNDEIYEILELQFPKGFVLAGVFDEVTEDGIDKDSTFTARNGNISSCFGLAHQLTRDVQTAIDSNRTEWVDKDE